MNRKLDLIVGQKVVVKIIETSNASRGRDMALSNIDKWCFDGEVVKVGRKFITVKFRGWHEEQFSIEDDYRQKYTIGGADYKLYLSKEDVLEEVESDDLYRIIKERFSGWKNIQYTLSQLKRIKEILDEK